MGISVPLQVLLTHIWTMRFGIILCNFFPGKKCILLSKKYGISDGLLEVKRYSNSDSKNQELHSKMVMLKTKTHLYNIKIAATFFRLNGLSSSITE
jgi:hypothetical protein